MEEKYEGCFSIKKNIIFICVALFAFFIGCTGSYLYGRNVRISDLESTSITDDLRKSKERCEYLERELESRISAIESINRELIETESVVDDCIGIVQRIDSSNRLIIESNRNIETTSLNIQTITRELALRVDNYEKQIEELRIRLSEIKSSTDK